MCPKTIIGCGVKDSPDTVNTKYYRVILLQTVDGKQLVVRLRSDNTPRSGDRPKFPQEDENAKLFVSAIPPNVQNEQLQVSYQGFSTTSSKL